MGRGEMVTLPVLACLRVTNCPSELWKSDRETVDKTKPVIPPNATNDDQINTKWRFIIPDLNSACAIVQWVPFDISGPRGFAAMLWRRFATRSKPTFPQIHQVSEQDLRVQWEKISMSDSDDFMGDIFGDYSADIICIKIK